MAEYNLEESDRFISFLLTKEFFINKYKAKHTSLGYALNDLKQRIFSENNEPNQLRSELFYSIAECIITDQVSVFEQLGRINFKKQNTNEELIRSLQLAKTYIDEHLFSELNIDILASTAYLSKYHFIRLFKTIYRYSPYQYILQNRLIAAKSFLEKGMSVFDVAFQIGFSDVPTFSKAFKKKFGHAPSNHFF